jgi:hypothetical protein
MHEARCRAILGDGSRARALAEVNATSITERVEQLLEVPPALSAAPGQTAHLDNRIRPRNEVEQVRR